MKTFALISKNDYCVNWKNSFFIQTYKKNDKLVAPDWAEWCKSDNAAYMTAYENLTEEEKAALLTKDGYVVIDPYSTDGLLWFATEQEAIAELWNHCPDDYRVETFTQDEAKDELCNDEVLRGQYADYCYDTIMTEENFISNLNPFFEWVWDEYRVYTRKYCLAHIAIYNTDWI